MKKVLVLVASLAVVAGLMAPSGAAARTKVPKPSAQTTALITGAAAEVKAVLDEAVACANAAVANGAAGVSSPAVIACVRTAVTKARAIVNRAIDAIETSMGDLGAAGKTAFRQVRAAIASAFDRVDAQLAAAGG
jgi:hypothetical protein